MARGLIAICAGGVAVAVGCGTMLSIEEPPKSDPEEVEAGPDDPDARAVEASSDGEGTIEVGPDVTPEPACLRPGDSCTEGDKCCTVLTPYACRNGNCLACTPLGKPCQSEAECCDLGAGCKEAICCLPTDARCNEGAECCSNSCQMGMCK